MKTKIKKTMLSLGTIAIVITPITTMVSCGSSNIITDGKYEGQTISEDFEWPAGVTEIGKRAFENTILPKNFKIPKTIKKIGIKAFEGATFQGNFEVPNTIEQIEGSAFERIKVKGFFNYNPSFDYVRGFGHADFTYSTWFKISDKITKIRKYAFYGVRFPKNFSLK